MNLINTLDQATNQTMVYAPLALSAVTSIEQAAAQLPGETKSQMAVNIILAGAAAAQNVPIPSVEAAATLVSIFVGILNATGVFKHKAKTAPATPPPPAAPANLAALTGSQGIGVGGSTGVQANLTGQTQGTAAQPKP